MFVCLELIEEPGRFRKLIFGISGQVNIRQILINLLFYCIIEQNRELSESHTNIISQVKNDKKSDTVLHLYKLN